MPRPTLAAVLALAGFGLLSPPTPARAREIVIDDFSFATPGFYPFVQTVPTGNAGNGPGPEHTPTVIGGVREVSASFSSVVTPGVDRMSIDIPKAGGGVFEFASTAGSQAAAFLAYGTQATGGPDLGLNLDPTKDAFHVDVAASDRTTNADPLYVSIQLIGANGTKFDTILTAVTAPGVINTPVNRVNDPTILKDVDSVGFLIFSASPGLDFRLNGITLTSDTTVAPEPAGAAVVLAVAGGTLLARRRRLSRD